METKRTIEPARVTFIVTEALAFAPVGNWGVSLFAYAGAKYQTDASNAADAVELAKNYTTEELAEILKTYAATLPTS